MRKIAERVICDDRLILRTERHGERFLQEGSEQGARSREQGAGSREQGAGMSRRVKALPTRLSPCDELILIAEFCVGFVRFVVEKRQGF